MLISANPLVPGSPDIDITTSFKLTENLKAGRLDISVTQVGDKFPAAETFIQDTKGNSLFIGVSPYEGNPYTSLPGGNERPMMSADFSVNLSETGEFLGVTSGESSYSPDAWNKMMQGQSLSTEQPEVTFGGGSSGGGGASGQW